MSRRTGRPLAPALLLSAVLAPLPVLAAQAGSEEERLRARVAEGLRSWVEEFEAGRLAPSGLIRGGEGLQPPYARHARSAGLLAPEDQDRLTHFDVLQKMLFFAETHPSEAVADALLDVAACGFARSLMDRDAMMVRDAGHWTLMRTERQASWFAVLRAAAGERLPFLAAETETAEKLVPRRIAALKLLGMRKLPVFRSTIEGSLLAADPRVRLAAAEALGFRREPQTLGALSRALGSERHPVVSQALVMALIATLRGQRIDGPLAAGAVRRALCMLGRVGWRTDMDILRLVEQHPSKEAVPRLIDVLEGANSPDPLVAAVNRAASPILRQKAHDLLRRMTGAIIPANRPAEWREFWRKEQDRIVVPERLDREPDPAATAARGFFGIPVVGREVALVIDTSGSMEQPGVGTSSQVGPRRDREPSRLEAAREQLLLAVQSMPDGSRYHLLTFESQVTTWSRKPMSPTPSSLRSLSDLVGRLRAKGGTDVFAALAEAMSLEEQRFGEAIDSDLDELFLLTDGEPTVGLQDPEQILSVIREANRYRKIRINTVYTGEGKGAEFLRRLAQENGGVYVQR